MPTLNIQIPDREMRDRAMGRYMDVFARMERMIQMCIQMLLDIDEFRARPIFATLMTKQTVDLLEAAGKMMLIAADAQKITELCERIAKRNRRRNHLVHGYWTIHVTPSDNGDTAEWIRVYDSVDPALAGDPHDPKLLGFYTFTVPALDKASDHVEEMVQALSVLAVDIPNQLARQQTAEERFRSWVADRLAPSGGVALRLSQYRYP